MSRPEFAKLLVHDQPVKVTWAELDRVHRLAHDDSVAALALGEQWLDERGVADE